jgi:hypothetical protein
MRHLSFPSASFCSSGFITAAPDYALMLDAVELGLNGRALGHAQVDHLHGDEESQAAPARRCDKVIEDELGRPEKLYHRTLCRLISTPLGLRCVLLEGV